MTSATHPDLPNDILVLDRGWLSSTNIICLGPQPAIIDTSYIKDEAATLAQVQQALGDTPLAAIAHTHLHSDHCGGTHALQQTWPDATTWVPAASFDTVQGWDEDELTYAATGQRCRPFRADRALQPGSHVALGQRQWQIHAAPGHDDLAVFLFDAQDRILISGDALWALGIGIIFPQIEGSGTFDAFGQTLDAIEALAPDWVIPGHGGAIARADGGIAQALTQARERLAYFKQNPMAHTTHAARVLVKYLLMDLERLPRQELWRRVAAAGEFQQLHALSQTPLSVQAWTDEIVAALMAKGALRAEGETICDVRA